MTDDKACKAKNIYYLANYRKSLPTPAINKYIQTYAHAYTETSLTLDIHHIVICDHLCVLLVSFLEFICIF